jgi:hypothetical protein
MHQFFARLKIHSNYILACLVLTPVLIHPAWAALPPIYDVELIIFINKYPNDDGEQWDTPDPDTIKPSGFFPEDHFTELAADFYTIGNISYALDRSGRYSVLFHRAWRQLAYDKAHAVAYPIHSLAENGRDSVEGIIKLVRERFLHLDVDVQLMSAAQGREVLYSDSPDSQPVFELIETRRIKSNVLHYFDHPRFGMIAKVTPYIPPEAEITDEEEQQEEPVTEETVVDEPNIPDDQLTR